MPTATMIAAPASLATRWFLAMRATFFPTAIEIRVHALVITAMSRLDEKGSVIFLVPYATPTPRLSRFEERARISTVRMCMSSIFGLEAGMCKSRHNWKVLHFSAYTWQSATQLPATHLCFIIVAFWLFAVSAPAIEGVSRGPIA